MSSHNTILTIQIVGWNSAKHLPAAMKALHRIPADAGVAIRYIDNGSTDNSIEIVRSLMPTADVMALPRNEGFAGAHNRGLEHCSTPFVLIHDPDIQIEWAGIKQLLKAFDNPKIAAVQGKILRQQKTSPAIIDSAGIILSGALNGKERGAFEEDRGQWVTPVSVIAPTGACALYRVSALKEVAHTPHEYFDKDFFAYKEDVDLGWRLNRHGWQCQYIPVFVAYHNRTLGKRGFLNWGLNPRSILHRLKSPRTRYSLRNWVWMIVKNASVPQVITHTPVIAVRLAVFILLSLLSPSLFHVWPQIIQGIPTMIQKRHLP